MSAQRMPQPPQVESSTITFVLNGQTHRVHNPDSNRTLLGYLREDLGCKGTKEGCAEGDCGACTVVVTERHGDRPRSRAVNACIQFLPTLHGKEITTVEGVTHGDGRLHPIQQAMVDCHASQCGFCTPGFVMSLYALSTSTAKPTRDEIECALAGNLCRCTGYRPIVEAVMKIDAYRGEHRAAGPTLASDQAAGVSIAGTNGSVVLNRADRQYWAPDHLAEFADIRAAHPEAIILAGGTDLALAVTKKRMDLPALIYVGRVAELKHIECTATALEIGAAVTLTDAFESLVEEYPELVEWARRFASPPIRNVGTLGGNIGNGSPIGDSMPVLMALGVDLILRCGSATRSVPLDAFYTGYQRNVLIPGEFIERIRIPRRQPNQFLRAYKISKRSDQDISALLGAFALTFVDGVVTDARIAFGGMAAIPKRATLCESMLVGRTWNEATVRGGMQTLMEDFAPIDDMRASHGYRRLVAQNLLYKCFAETTGAGRISVAAHEV